MRAILYIDDCICASASKAKSIEDRNIVISDLERAGFVLNVSKSHLEPHQIADWLGFIIDLCTGSFRVLSDKVDRLKATIHSISIQVRRVAARVLASVFGQIIPISLAIGPVSRLQTRALYAILNRRRFWAKWLSLMDEALVQLQFWKQDIDHFNG